MKIEEKERKYIKMLEEASKMAVNLTTTGHMVGVITHDNKIRTDEFDYGHECASAVRHVG